MAEHLTLNQRVEGSSPSWPRGKKEMADFELIEHTADIGVRVYGKDLPELFRNSAIALFSLITDFKPQPKKEQRIKLHTQTWEDLLVTWLNELVSNFFTREFLPHSYKIIIHENKEKELDAIVKGEDFSPYKKKINLEVKAATYHNLKIERDERGVKAEIIFDV